MYFSLHNNTSNKEVSLCSLMYSTSLGPNLIQHKLWFTLVDLSHFFWPNTTSLHMSLCNLMETYVKSLKFYSSNVTYWQGLKNACYPCYHSHKKKTQHKKFLPCDFHIVLWTCCFLMFSFFFFFSFLSFGYFQFEK
jgi:hypothetical protein